MGFDSGEKRWEGGSEGCRGEAAGTQREPACRDLKHGECCEQGKEEGRRLTVENGTQNVNPCAYHRGRRKRWSEAGVANGCLSE